MSSDSCSSGPHYISSASCLLSVSGSKALSFALAGRKTFLTERTAGARGEAKRGWKDSFSPVLPECLRAHGPQWRWIKHRRSGMGLEILQFWQLLGGAKAVATQILERWGILRSRLIPGRLLFPRGFWLFPSLIYASSPVLTLPGESLLHLSLTSSFLPGTPPGHYQQITINFQKFTQGCDSQRTAKPPSTQTEVSRDLLKPLSPRVGVLQYNLESSVS